MAQDIRITNVCDLCGAEESAELVVEPHEIKLDQKATRVTDACDPCWGPVAQVLENVMKAGTSKKIADRRVAAARTTRATVSAPTVPKKSTEKPGRTTSKKTTGPKSAPKSTAKKAAKKTTSRALRKAPA